jgi:hypothetical protein
LTRNVRSFIKCVLPVLAIGVFIGLCFMIMHPHNPGHAYAMNHRFIHDGQAFSYNSFDGHRRSWGYRETGFHPYLPFLFYILIAAVGCLLLVKTKGRAAKKYIGIGFLLFAGISLFPFSILIVAVLWLLWKFFGNNSRTFDSKPMSDRNGTIVASYDMNQVDPIDEWEKQIRNQKK